MIDLDTLINALDPEARSGRRHADDVAVAIRAQVPHLTAAEIPGLVADTIRRGAAEGRWTPARTTTVMRGRTALPKTVTIPATRPPVAQLTPASAYKADGRWMGAAKPVVRSDVLWCAAEFG